MYIAKFIYSFQQHATPVFEQLNVDLIFLQLVRISYSFFFYSSILHSTRCFQFFSLITLFCFNKNENDYKVEDGMSAKSIRSSVSSSAIVCLKCNIDTVNRDRILFFSTVIQSKIHQAIIQMF